MASTICKVKLEAVAWIWLAASLLVLAALPSVSSAVELEAAQVFPSAEAARGALVSAVLAKDHAALRAIFGPVAHELEPGDPVEQAAEFEHFYRRVAESVQLDKEGEGRGILLIGERKWPFPVPLVKRGDVWFFDTEAGREEIVNRRIGRNELLVIKTCAAYVDAQREYYAMTEPDGDQIPKYAQHMISSPGRRDGLYWPTAAGAEESPLGPLVARAKEEGYMQKRQEGEKGPRPFHGYYFRILKRQGENAPGGKFDYVINGNMVAGFGLIAYPARWGVSGVMTFIVNQRGRVYQKDLGHQSAEIARDIQEFNPDLSWKVVEEQ